MNRKEGTRHVRSQDLLPPPPTGRALLLAGLAAIAGAAVWGLMSIYANYEHGIVAWGIGGLIGFAIIKAGGHGQFLAASGAMLAVLAIGTGKNISYQSTVSSFADDAMVAVDDDYHTLISEYANDWQALGDSPSSDDVDSFVLDRYEVDSVEEFRTDHLPLLEWFHETKPTLEQLHDRERAGFVQRFTAQYGFVDYLRDNFHLLDILFVALGLVTAFVLVTRYTNELRVEARRRLRAERDAEQAEADANERSETEPREQPRHQATPPPLP